MQDIEPLETSALEDSTSSLLEGSSSLLESTPESQAGEPLVDQDTLQVDVGGSLPVNSGEPQTEEDLPALAAIAESSLPVAEGEPLKTITPGDYDKEELGKLLSAGMQEIQRVLAISGLAPQTATGLAARLGTDQPSVSKKKGEGNESLKKWSAKKDPQGIAWEYCPDHPEANGNFKYFPVVDPASV